MTILPKKKHQESRKNDQDHDAENRNRARNRSNPARNNRLQQHQPPDDFDFDDLGNGLEASVPSLTPPMFNDLDARDSHEGLPHKRSRHKQGSPYFNPSTPNPHHSSSRVSREESPIDEGNEDGYNSSDEHGPRGDDDDDHDDLAVSKGIPAPENLAEKEAVFERELRERKGFHIKQMATDGACLFRAVADQVYGDQEMNTVVRRHCMDYMVQNRDFFSQYITEDFLSYIRRKRVDHSHGNHIEMQALSEMYNRPIEVYQYSIEPINTFFSRSHNNDDNPPIRLSYHGNVHYNSIIDPYNPTVGVGLGLAGYKPGTEDQNNLEKGSQESEALLLEQAMLEDKIKATDWEATDEQLAELAARESYLMWLNENQKTQTSSAGASCSSSTSTQSKRSSPPHDAGNSRRSPSRGGDGTSPRRSPARETKRSTPVDSLGNRTLGTSAPLSKHVKGESPACDGLRGAEPLLSVPEMEQPKPSNDWSYALGYGADWDNDPVLAAVLAQSQQEYLDSFNRTSSSSNLSNSSNNNNNNNNTTKKDESEHTETPHYSGL